MTTAPVKLADAHVLDHVHKLVSSALYATPEQIDACVLAYAATHATFCFPTTFRFLFASDEPGSGKSTGIHLAKLLAWRFWDCTNATEPAIRSRYGIMMGETTLGHHEISKVFGESGANGKQSLKYTILVAGYESGATAPYSNGKVPEDIPIFGPAFLAGLRKAAPDDLRDRSIIVQMRKAPDRIAENLEDVLHPGFRAKGFKIQEKLHQWARANTDELADIALNQLRGLHPKLTARRRQVWCGLFAIALTAGGSWPDRCLRAFQALALDASDRPVLVPEEQMLLDASGYAERYMTQEGVIFSRDLLRFVKSLEREEHQMMSERDLFKIMAATLGTAQSIRGTFAYTPDDKPSSPHKGWYMAEHLIAAADLRAKLDASSHDATEPDEYDEMYD